ncbi:choline dehydrogenase 7 [Xenoophorus captivus]|uniref:Choline dehydrogenase 7 n=1 Tax=Xenoophorus captivus TaxID=1517983 RepID=A0ABV0QLN3_9TELE
MQAIPVMHVFCVKLAAWLREELHIKHTLKNLKAKIVTLYLVKWCSLAYEDATWELKADIDQSKIDEYERIAAREPNTERVDRPSAADWNKLESSREYRNGNALREYQLEGLNWLTFNWYNS